MEVKPVQPTADVCPEFDLSKITPEASSLIRLAVDFAIFIFAVIRRIIFSFSVACDVSWDVKFTIISA